MRLRFISNLQSETLAKVMHAHNKSLLTCNNTLQMGTCLRKGLCSRHAQLLVAALQNVVVALGSWHLFMGMCAYIVADRAGEPWLKPTAKVTIGTASWPLLQCCSMFAA